MSVDGIHISYLLTCLRRIWRMVFRLMRKTILCIWVGHRRWSRSRIFWNQWLKGLVSEPFFGLYFKCQVLFIQYLLIPVLGYYGKPIILNINVHFINVRSPRTFKYWRRIHSIITSTNSGYRHWKLEVQHNFLNIISYRDGCSYGSWVISWILTLCLLNYFDI